MNPIIENLEQNLAVKKEAKMLLLPEKNIPEETKLYNSRLTKYGINNDTVQFINNKTTENIINNNKIKRQTDEILLLKTVINDFIPYRVISYKSLHNVCEEYNLYISKLRNYKKDIPEDALEDLENFEQLLKNLPQTYSNIPLFTQNFNPSFDIDSFKTNLFYLDFKDAFYIAAPSNHFHKNTYNTKIGRELINMDKPKFSFNNLKLSMPKYNDPIIYFPIKLVDRIYCIIVSAWDKEGDDSRIKAML